MGDPENDAGTGSALEIELGWRTPFTNEEIHLLHAAAFDTKLYTEADWDWVTLVDEHSFGWVTARIDGELVGFANVITDGFAHAWIQDVMTAPARQRSGIGVQIVDLATEELKKTECEWLHVDFDDDVADFYYRKLGFQKTNGGLKYLQ